ncbi:2591_t:CDS:2, partial [Gigaspora rosea]
TPAFFTALSRVYDYYKSGKEGNSQKKDSQKIEAEKNLTKKEMDIRTKEEEHGNPEKITKNGKNQKKEKTHPSLLEPKKKDLK